MTSHKMPASAPPVTLKPLREASEITHYHVHVYYDDAKHGQSATRAAAMWLREQIAAHFPVEMGRWWEQAVGPHPTPQYQISFAREQFGALVPWLMLNRQGLSILIHPNTDQELDDHVDSALWLGPALSLNREVLQISLAAAGQGGAHSRKIP